MDTLGDGYGFGNDLANWPNKSLKLYGQVSLSDRIKFHVDSRIVWDFQGSKDGFGSIRNAVEGSSLGEPVENALRIVNNVNAFEADLRANFSISLTINNSMELQLFGFNLFGKNNKRYSYDFGNNSPAPRRVRFIEEPRVFGIRLGYGYNNK